MFHADSAPGIWPFEAFPSRKVSPTFPPGMNPPVVQPAVTPSGEPSGRPDRPRLLGFDPHESPSPRPTRLTRTRPDAPLGFDPFQGNPPDAWPTFPRGLLSRAWQHAAALTAAIPAPQSLDQRPADPTSAYGPAKRGGPAALLGFLHRFAPTVRTGRNPGYGFTSQDRPHYWKPQPALWAADPTLPEPVGPKCGAKQTQPLGHRDQKVGLPGCPSEASVMTMRTDDVAASIHPLVESAARLELPARPVPRSLVPRSRFARSRSLEPCGVPESGDDGPA